MLKLDRFGATALAIGVAGLICVSGCGGSSYLTEGPAEGTGENYVAVEMEVGASGDGFMPASPSLSKDAGGNAEGTIEEGGVGQSDDVLSYVKCEFVNGITPVGGETFTPGGIEVVDAANYPGDCDNESACVGCYNRFETLDLEGNPIPDPTESRCVWNCVGIVPEHLLESDPIELDLLWKVKLVTNEPSEGINVMRFDFNSPFPTIFESDMADIASTTSDDYDLSLCDESGDVEEMGVSLTDDPLTTTDLSGFDAFDDNGGAGPIVATKALDVTGMGTPADGYSDCYIEVQVDGNLLVSVDQSEGTHSFCANYCNDYISCPNFCGSGTFSAPLDILEDSGGNSLINNTAALIDEVIVNFGVPMNVSTVKADNFIVESSALGTGQPQVEILSIEPWSYDAADGIADDDFVIIIDNAYEYALQDMIYAVTTGAVAADGRILDSPVITDPVSACSLSDTWYVNSQSCWDPDVSYNNNYFPPTLTTWAQIDERGASVLVNDLANNMLLYRDSGKADSTQQTVWISKPMNEPSDSWQLDVKISNADGFSYDGGGTDMDGIGFTVQNIDSTGYSIGIQTVEIGGVDTQTCYALYMLNGVPGGGSYLDDCDIETDFIFKLSYNRGAQDVVAEVSFDDGSSWHDIYVEGDQFPNAPHPEIDYISMTGTQYGSIGVKSGNDGTTKDNTADIEYVRFYGLDSLTGATPPQFSDVEYEESGTFAMQHGGMLIDVTDGVNFSPIYPNDEDVRLDQDIAMIFDDYISPIDWTPMLPANMYVAPVQQLTGQATPVDGAVSGLVMGPGDYEDKRAAWIEVTDAAVFGQQIGDSGAYHYQKQDLELHIKNQELENGYVQRNDYVQPFSTACALEDHFFQDLRSDCYYTVSNTDVSTAIDAAGSALEITRTGAAGVYEISKPANQNDTDAWALYIEVNVSNIDRTPGSTDSIALRLTDTADGSGEGYHFGVMAYDALVGGDWELTCFAGLTNNLGQFIEMNYAGPCDSYEGQDIIIKLVPFFGSVTTQYSTDGGQIWNNIGISDLTLLSYLTWTDLYLNLDATFSPTSSMEVDVDRFNAIEFIGRSAAELDSSDYMVTIIRSGGGGK